MSNENESLAQLCENCKNREFNEKEYINSPEKLALFKPENLIKTETKLSPSGRFRLTIETYKTGQGTWNYTKGIVHRVEDKDPLYGNNKEVISLYRDYDIFTHALFTRVDPITRKEEDWLISGEHYEYQTFVNLDTGVRYDNNEGYFCWTEITPSPKGDIIAVEGCVWACPYDYVFYDLSKVGEPGKPFWTPIKENFVNPHPKMKEINDKEWKDRTDEEKQIDIEYSYDFYPLDDCKIRWINDYTFEYIRIDEITKESKRKELEELAKIDEKEYRRKIYIDNKEYCDRVIYRHYLIEFNKDQANIKDVTTRPFIKVEWEE